MVAPKLEVRSVFVVREHTVLKDPTLPPGMMGNPALQVLRHRWATGKDNHGVYIKHKIEQEFPIRFGWLSMIKDTWLTSVRLNNSDEAVQKCVLPSRESP